MDVLAKRNSYPFPLSQPAANNVNRLIYRPVCVCMCVFERVGASVCETAHVEISSVLKI